MKQSDALEILKMGKNVFLTGEPGSGKSHTVRAYVAFLQSRGIHPALTASTGIAATHIGGITIHSWSGLGIRKHISYQECKELASNANVARRITQTRILIIDEISMLDGNMLNAIDMICRVIKGVDLAFGGMQIVFVGDFFQLPPVTRDGEEAARFAYDTNAWESAACTVCYLSEQHRQEDAMFLEILSALRQGTLQEKHIVNLTARNTRTPHTDITKLYAHNADVDRMNTERLNALSEKIHTFTMTTQGNAKIVAQLQRGCLSPEILSLKKGARVMFTKNNPAQHYVNGSIGHVIDFHKEHRYPIIELVSGRTLCAEPETWSVAGEGVPTAAIQQVPLRLAWALTIHKSQGMSLDSAYMDLQHAFAYGQGYVALSRVRTLAGLFLGGLNTRALEVDPEIQQKDAEFRTQSAQALHMLLHQTVKDRGEEQESFLRTCGAQKKPPTKKTRPLRKA